MSDETTKTQNIDKEFTATITLEPTSGWLCVIMDASGDFFGTRKPVKVAGTVDGHPVRITMLPIGNGNHMLPLKAELRKILGKDRGDEVTVRLQQRFT
jgi:hypothetical protein